MNRILSLLSFTFLSLHIGYGQELMETDAPYSIPDSLQIVEITRISSMNGCGRFLIPVGQEFGLYQDSAELAMLVKKKEFVGQCKEFVLPEIDFRRHTLIGTDFFIDCHGTLFLRMARDSIQKVYTIFADLGDGMCRGMTSIEYWFLMPSLPDGYRVEMVKRRHPYR